MLGILLSVERFSRCFTFSLGSSTLDLHFFICKRPEIVNVYMLRRLDQTGTPALEKKGVPFCIYVYDSGKSAVTECLKCWGFHFALLSVWSGDLCLTLAGGMWLLDMLTPFQTSCWRGPVSFRSLCKQQIWHNLGYLAWQDTRRKITNGIMLG